MFIASAPCLTALALRMMLLVVALPAQGQAPTNEPAPAELALTLQSRLSELKNELSRFLLGEHTTNLPPGATLGEAGEYRVMKESLVLTYQQHIDELLRLQAAKRQQAEFEQQARTWSGFAEPPPYSLLLVDDLRDSVQSLRAKIAAAETSRDVLVKFAAQFQASLAMSEGRQRILAEQLESSMDPAQTARLKWQQDFEQARSRLALAKAGLNQTRRQSLETVLVDSRQRLALLQRQLILAEQQVRFSQADLDRLMKGFDTERRDFQAELDAVEAENQRCQQALAGARQELQKHLQSTPGAAAAADPAARTRELQVALELRTVQAQASAERLITVRQLLELLLMQRALWQTRFDTFGTQDLMKLQQGYRRLSVAEALVTTAKPYFSQQLEMISSLMNEQRNRLRDPSASASDHAQAQDLLTVYGQREQLAYRALRDFEKMERLVQRWRESLDQERRSLPFFGRVRDLFGSFSLFWVKLWQFELFAAQDTITYDGQPITGRRSVTIGKVVMAVLILAFGYWFCLLLARLLERVAIRRLKVEPARADLIRRWVSVFLLAGLAVLSLIFVKIPLTVFAFLGGALAIGLGFGTQNVLKNFISGIIILFERPLRIGDLVEIEGKRGRVSSIGIRSSVLQLGDSTEMLIPNSVLLENNLTNCTYSNARMRFTIAVGVAYGTDTRQVAQLLAETAHRHGLVERQPAPQVLFLAFGDNQLEFELRFWVDVEKHSSTQVASDLRHMIAASFAQHGIEMAYPQRDIHFDASRPLKVQVVPPEKGPPATILAPEATAATTTTVTGKSTSSRDPGALPG